MHFNFKFMLLFFALLSILLGHIDCKSYFGIGNRYLGDQLLLRDEVENRHTGLTEVPVIAFEYAVKEPITYIEIMSEENVAAIVHFSYFDAVINGTVEAVASKITPEGLNQPFKICVKIYGFNDTKLPEFFAAATLRQEQYDGSLVSHAAPGEIDHLPLRFSPMEELDEFYTDKEDDEGMSEEAENELLGDFKVANKTVTANEIDETSFNEAFDETFESMDLYVTLGHRQKNDELLFETYQSSEPATATKTEHKVTFYFVDKVYITYMEFVLIDYKANKTEKEIEKGYYVTYSHFTPSTMKAVIQDFYTTSLVAKMYVYGYKDGQRPESYVSYIPKNYRADNLFLEHFLTTESPKMHFKTQLNALQRDAEGFASIPPELYKSQKGEEPPFVITSIREVPRNGGNNLQHLTAFKLMILSIFLGWSFFGLYA